MDKSQNLLVEGLERLGLIASRIRKNEKEVPQIEIDIILEELRNLYMVALGFEQELAHKSDAIEEGSHTEAKRAEEERIAAEAAAKRAEEERIAAAKRAEEERIAAEAAAKRAEEERVAAAKRAEEEHLAAEAAAKRAEEERVAAAKRAEEERIAAEAAAKRAEEERVAAEAAAKRAEERQKAAAAAIAAAAAPIVAQEAPSHEDGAAIERQMEVLSGNPNDELFSEPASARKAEPKREISLFDTLGFNAGGTAKPTIGDTLKQMGPSIGDRLDSKVRAQKVDDLRNVISINDKFNYMSELFHKNMKGYNDFILRLNGMTDREEALAYVRSVAADYKWNDSSDTVKSFYKIFDRKF